MGKGPGRAADGNHGLLSRSMAPSQEDENSIMGDTFHNKTAIELEVGRADALGDRGTTPGNADSVESTPSWAAPIRFAVGVPASVFWTTARRRTATPWPTGQHEKLLQLNRCGVPCPWRERGGERP